MHDALLVSEVLSGIFDYLAEDTARHPDFPHVRDTRSRKAGRRALTILARTCRAFSEPALDTLWRRLRSLQPFVLCLPPRASHDGPTADRALPLFNEEDWSIVSRYAPRVYELTLENDSLSVAILQSLWFRTTLLLPNLRKLYWFYQDCTVIGSIRLLLSPSLVHLHVWLDSGDHISVLGLLECYHTLCPNLKSLYFGHLSSYMTAAISRAICRSPNLETLSCDLINEATLIHVAGSRCLKKFTASLFDYQPDNLRRLAGYGLPDRPPFENLRALELRIEDLSSIIPYLKAHHQPFEEVSFELRALAEPGVFHKFFAALSSATRRRTLRRIRLLSVDLRRRYGRSSQPVDFRVFGPVMTFNLHQFDVNLHNLVSLDDDEVARLVQAWPELDTFYLNQYSGWEYLPSLQIPTLRGLLLLLARCPKLRNLGMCVDARNIPSLTEDESSIRNMAITRPVLMNSPIQEPVARVAQFLLEHFPSLITLTAPVPFNGRPADDYRYIWREVNRQVREIKGWDSSAESSDSEMEIV